MDFSAESECLSARASLVRASAGVWCAWPAGRSGILVSSSSEAELGSGNVPSVIPPFASASPRYSLSLSPTPSISFGKGVLVFRGVREFTGSGFY